MQWQEIQQIDFKSLLKISVVLGVLWGVLGWIVGSFAILSMKMLNPTMDFSMGPMPFAIIDLLFALIASLVGSVITALVGAYVYNWFASRYGGIVIGVRDINVTPVRQPYSTIEHKKEA